MSQNYKITDKIERGSYGEIYDTNHHNIVCKISKCSSSCGLNSSFLQEVSSLKLMNNHPNIVKIHHIDCNDKQSEIYMEKYPINLYQYISDDQPVEQFKIKTIIYQILSVINDAHQNHLIHGDIKPTNILLDDQKQVIVCDWGFGVYMSDHNYCETMPNLLQTLTYRAPEVLCQLCPYTEKIDVWSIGIILCELYNKELLFNYHMIIKNGVKIEDIKSQLMSIYKFFGYPRGEKYKNVNIRYDYHSYENLLHIDDPQCLDLIDRMTQYDPNLRISCMDALQHPYFHDITEKYVYIPRPLQTFKIQPLKFAEIMKFTNNDRINVFKNIQTIIRHYQLPNIVYFNTCIYFDTYLSKNQIEKQQLTLLCLCCLMISCKINDCVKCTIEQLIDTMESINYDFLTCQEFKALELDIVKSLDFSLFHNNLYHSIKHYINKLNVIYIKEKYITQICYEVTYEIENYEYDQYLLAGVIVSYCMNQDLSLYDPQIVKFVDHIIVNNRFKFI